MLQRSSHGKIAPCCVFGLALCLSGCHANMYDARSLPIQYAAPPVVNVQALDLSRLAQARATSDTIHAGDVLNVAVVTGAVGEVPENWSLRVAQDGTVNVPLVGAVAVTGTNLLEAERAIRNASIERGVFRRPAVSTTLAARRTHRITVMGAVESPGAYQLPVPNSDLLSALVAAGGLTPQADRTIEIRHSRQDKSRLPMPRDPPPDVAALTSYSAAPATAPGAEVELVDLVEASEGKSNTGHALPDGSIVTVMRRPPRFVHVIGLVRRPNQFEMPHDRPVRVLDAIALAGGLSVPIANKVYVIRKPAETEQAIVVKVSLREAKKSDQENILLMAGDVVSVEETPVTFTVGLLRQFFSIGVSSRVPF